MLHCISFHHSPEERCTSETFGGTKFCVFHLKSLPKKSYKNIDDIDVEMNVEELNLSSVLAAYKKSQKVIIARTLFMEKHVCLEARDFGHRRRISLLMTFHQRCDARLESMNSKTKGLESASEENIRDNLPQILKDVRKSFTSTKKKINDWKVVIDHLKEARKQRHDFIKEVNSLSENSPSLLSDFHYLMNLVELSAKMFRNDRDLRILQCFWHNSNSREKWLDVSPDDGQPSDPKAFKYHSMIWDAVLNCFRDAGFNFIIGDSAEELFKVATPKQVEAIRSTEFWTFMTQLWESERALGLNTSFKTGYNTWINFEFSFFITLFFSDKPPSHFTIYVRKNGGWNVNRIELKDVPKENVSYRDYIMTGSKKGVSVGPSADSSWMVVNKESRKLVKRIMIASKLGKKGEDIIKVDVEKYNEFRKTIFS